MKREGVIEMMRRKFARNTVLTAPEPTPHPQLWRPYMPEPVYDWEQTDLDAPWARD